MSQLWFDYDTTTTRLQRKIDMLIFARVESLREAGVRSAYDRLRSDYDISRAPASIQRKQKINTSIFRRSRVVVVS